MISALMKLGNSFDMQTRPLVGQRPEYSNLFLGSFNRHLFSLQHPDRLWDPPQPSMQWVGWIPSFEELRRTGREADHSPRSSIKVKN
jgi:hypothetical protein